MDFGSVFDDLQMFLLNPEILDRLGSVLAQPGLKARIDPSAGDDFGAALGSNFFCIDLDPRIDGLGVDDALLDKQAFQRLYPKGGLGRQVAVKRRMDIRDSF